MEKQGDLRPCEIRIDKDGIWYFRGAEMFRKEILQLFYDGMRLDEYGRYILEINNERCLLEVEDTPFVVRSVFKQGRVEEKTEAIHLKMMDDGLEVLDPATLFVGEGNVLYCSVRSRFRARFSRAAYYQISEFIEGDQRLNEFSIALNGKKYPIADHYNREG